MRLALIINQSLTRCGVAAVWSGLSLGYHMMTGRLHQIRKRQLSSFAAILEIARLRGGTAKGLAIRSIRAIKTRGEIDASDAMVHR